jgi:predicted RNA-binding protein YlqC (UPF0109 family)
MNQYNPHMTNATPDAVLVAQRLITLMSKSLVDDEAAIRVIVETSETETVLRLHLAPGDIGKVIGKQGRTARSLRTIIAALGAKQGVRYSLDIVESRD